MRHLIQSLIAAAPLVLCGESPSVHDGVRRVQAHLLIDDPVSALNEAERLKLQYPQSKEAGAAFIEALSASGMEENALDEWNRLSLSNPDLISDRRLLEEIGWGVLKKGLSSTQYGVRLGALIGSYLTRDVRAVPVILKMMRDSNAVIRSVAIQMSTGYGDAILKDEVARILKEEKVWMVRLEAIKAVGALRIKHLEGLLESTVVSEKAMFEERHLAIQSLINMRDSATLAEIEKLAKSNRAPLRHLAASIALHFQMKEAKGVVVELASDANADVRIAALNALGLFYREEMEVKELFEILTPRLAESDPTVSITASWVAMLADPKRGEAVLEKWLKDSVGENRRLAAAALSATGGRGAKLAVRTLKESTDPYVRANVAIGLMGQRVEVKAAADSIFEFLTKEKRMWMWDTRPNPLFQVLAPSQVRHVDQIPNYPEAIDQMTRLNLVSLLAMVDDPRAIDALKSFLKEKKWGITGVAAATLLQEGDETSLDVVRALLDDPSQEVRLQACLVLAMYGKDESVLSELQKAYPGANFDMKLHILEALGNVANAETSTFLIGVLREPFPMLRVAAAASLIQSVNK